MGEVWIKEAEKLTPVGNHNPMSGVGGPRATLHCTVSNPGSFDAMHRVLTSKAAESHLLYDPKTDRLGQYFPLDRAARALARGTLAYSHNRVGSINIQIEVCAMPVDWTADWKPGPNFRAMLRAIRSWGIRDEFIYRPAKTGTDRVNVVRPDNMLTSTAGGGKWWGHCHYGQGETHWDPGPINLARFFGAAPTQEDEVTPQDIQAIINGVLSAKVVDASKIPFGGKLDPDLKLTLPEAASYSMRWSLEDRDQGAVIAGIVEAQAAKGSALTADEVKAAFKAALSESVELDLSVKPSAVTE